MMLGNRDAIEKTLAGANESERERERARERASFFWCGAVWS